MMHKEFDSLLLRVLKRAAAAFLSTMLGLGSLIVFAGPAFASNPLTISKTSNPNPVSSGDQLTYTILVTNTGGARVTEVVLTDVVNGLTGVDGSNALVLTSSVGSCGQTGNTVTCNAGSLEGFQSWTVTIRGVVSAANGTVLNNTASVTGSKSAQTFTSSATVSTQVTAGAGGPLVDLALSIKAPSTTLPSHDMLYTLTVNNTGDLKASDVVLTVTLPSAVTFVVANATSLFNCGAPVSGTITCSGGAISAGANATVQVGVIAPSFDTTLTTSAAVDPFNAIPESDEFNNSVQATTQVGSTPPPDTLALEKTDSSDPIAPYETLTYTITLVNTSGSRADYVTVVDGTQGLDASSVQVSAVTTGTRVPMECTVSAPTVSCETTRFQPGATSVITITGLVITSPGTTIINTATVNGNIKNTGLTNTASALTTVRPSIDLSVTQYRTLPIVPDPVRAADRFDYTITVGNSGLYNADNVEVREPLPSGVFFDGFVASAVGTTCAVDASNVVGCVIPTIQGANSSGQIQGTTETITLFLIAPHAIGLISSTVTVDPRNTIPENDESNNTFLTNTDVLTGIDLTVSKTGTPDPVARNGTLKYTLTITNLGTQDATGIIVRDVLPAGAIFRGASDMPAGPGGNTHNFTCSESSGVVECIGGMILGTYSGSLLRPIDFAVIEIDVFAPDEPGIYHNEVRVDPYGTIPEKDESNNLFLLNTDVQNGIAAGAYKELRITLARDGTFAEPIATSGILNYTLKAFNTGAADAFNVVVSIKLAPGQTFRSANDTGVAPGEFDCAHSNGVITCIGGTVQGTDHAGPGGGSRSIFIETFAPPTPGSALVEAMVDPNNEIGEADESNNQANVTTLIAAGGNGKYIDLRVFDITTNHNPVAPSGTLDYNVVIENVGFGDAFNVSFRATLPSGAVFRSADDQGPDPPAFTCTHASGVVTCTGARINTMSARTVKISVFAPRQPGFYKLFISLDPNNAIPEGNEGNNSAEKQVEVAIGGGGGFIDLQISEMTDSPDSVEPGKAITYVLTIKNDGSDRAFQVAVRNVLPSGTTFVSANGTNNFLCNNSGQTVDCTGGSIDGMGATATITIVATAPLQHNVVITNQAAVDPADTIPESHETNNTKSTETTVLSQIDLKIEMTNGTAGTASEGDWTFTASNLLSGEARRVLVVANFSSGTIHLNTAGTPSGWNCEVFQNPVNQVRCVGDLVGASSATFTVHYFKTADETINSFAEIDPDNTIVETEEFANNRADSTG